MANLIVSAVSTFDNSGLKKGQKEISAFDKSVRKLGGTFATVFGAQKLLQFSKNAVNAFMEDEKAAKALEQQLKNVGYQFSAPGVEKYIANLQAATGVLDDELRPAFQSILTVTGSIARSQDALSTALNISAATGKSVAEVSQAIAKGYAGQTTALSRLGAGISKATLKTGDMDKIMGELNKKFAGQAAARLDTYAGKMTLLTVAAADAQETIGKGLLDALALLGKDTNISTATDLMDNFAQSTADAILGVGVLISKLKEIGDTKVGGALFDVKNIPILGAYLAGFSEIGAAQRGRTAPSNAEGRSSSRIYLQQLRLESKASKDLTNAKKAETAAIKAKTELDKLKDKFDLERISLLAALNSATDEETKLRIRAQLAILDNNEALAKKYNAELEATSATKALAESSNKAASALSSFGPALFNALGEMTARARNQIAPMEGGSMTYTVPQGATNQAAQGPVGGGAPSVGVTVNAGTIVTDQQLEAVIQQNVLQLLKSGNKLLPVGSL